MTAEIALINSQAIALAADSAATVRAGPNEKVYATANKVFALSAEQPIGVMIYGSAAFIRMPWETIVKTYRDRLAAKSFPTLERYAEDFLKYVRDEPRLASKDHEEWSFGTSLAGYYALMEREVKATLDALEAEDPHATVTKPDVCAEWDKCIKKHTARWRDSPAFSRATKKRIEAAEAVAKRIAKSVRENVLSKAPLQPSQKAALTRLGALVASREPRHMKPEARSGIVLAGFGTDDFLPQMVSFDIQGRLSGVLRHSSGKCHDRNVATAGVYPFAQTDVVWTFMRGIDPSYERLMNTRVRQLLRVAPGLILSNAKALSETERSALARAASDALEGVFDDVLQQLSELRQEKIVDPVLDAVIHAPKDELAAMAESLVSVTAFRRRMSLETETVGGPIDVAVITKGDGLVWIKRKHYFPRELNRHFFSRGEGR